MNFIRAHKTWFLSGVIVILLIIAISRSGSSPVANESVTVTRGDVVAQVAVTGRVKASEDVDLAFERGGKVARVAVKAGDKVGRGRLLANLSMDDLTAAVVAAKASVASQQASVDALKIGSRPEDVNIAQVKYDNAKLTLANKEVTLKDELESSYAESDNAIQYRIDQLYTSPDSSQPTFNIVTGNSRETDLNFARVVAGEALQKFRETSGLSDMSQQVAVTRASLESLRYFVARIADVINPMTATTNYSTATVEGYKADVSAARTTIENQIANVTVAYQTWLDSQANLNLTLRQLELAKAPARSEDIRAAEAKLDQLIAQAQSAQAEANKAIIFAPFTGVVTKQGFKLGETVSASLARISLASDSTYEIEANLPEADVAAVAVGQKAAVSLDAYGQDVYFDASVVAIEPGETVIDGVATYKTTLRFEKADPRIKSGMTANVTITTGSRKGVLTLPSRLIESEGSRTFVLVGTDAQTAARKEVVVGLRGADGSVEIVSGLNEGEYVTN